MSSTVVIYLALLAAIASAAQFDVPSTSVDVPPFPGDSKSAGFARPAAPKPIHHTSAPARPAFKLAPVKPKPTSAFSTYKKAPVPPKPIAPKPAAHHYSPPAPRSPVHNYSPAPKPAAVHQFSAKRAVPTAHSYYSGNSASRSVASGPDGQAQVLRQEQSIDHDGTYQYAYETNNGIQAEEQGVPKPLGGNPPEVAEQVQGSYSYTAPDGQVISVQYVANEDGFQPSGAHLPTPPPIPEAILRAIQYIQSHSS